MLCFATEKEIEETKLDIIKPTNSCVYGNLRKFITCTQDIQTA